MNYEVEVKYRLEDEARVHEAVAALGGRWSPVERQCDIYFAHPLRDFAATDEAFRLRAIGPKNRLTYKGPLVDRETKTRQEVEVALADGVDTARQAISMLVSLGFREVRRVDKIRRTAHFNWRQWNVEVSIDDVDGLGAFVEIEIIADEADWETAKSAALALADQLGLSRSERRSYLQMLIEQDTGR